MSSLPTFSEMPNLNRGDDSPASASSLDNPIPSTAFHSHTIPQTVPSISIPTFNAAAGLPSNNIPISASVSSTDMFGWLPSPAPSNFNFQTTFPSLENSSTSSALGFSPASPYPSFGFNYLPQNLTAQAPAHHRSRSHCNPADIFRLTPSTTSTSVVAFDFDMSESQGNATNIASPCSSVASSASGPSSEEKVPLKKEKKAVPQKLTLSMSSKTAPLPLVFGDDEGAEAGEGEAPGPKKRSRTAQACERCRIRKARCFGGNPCNRCVKRKFVCEFTATRQRGPNKPRSPEAPVHSTLANPRPGAAGAAGAKARRHSMHAIATTSAMATSVAGRFAPIRSRPPAPLPEVAAQTVGLGLELTPPAEDDTKPYPAVQIPRKMSAAAARQAAELERLTGTMNATSLLLSSAPPERHTLPHANTTGGGSGSNSVIGSGWTMISGNDLPINNVWMDDDMFQFSPDNSSAGGRTGMEEFANNFDFPWTPVSPQSMSQSLTVGGTEFDLAQNDTMDYRDDALKQLYGAVPMSNENEWFTAF